VGTQGGGGMCDLSKSGYGCGGKGDGGGGGVGPQQRPYCRHQAPYPMHPPSLPRPPPSQVPPHPLPPPPPPRYLPWLLPPCAEAAGLLLFLAPLLVHAGGLAVGGWWVGWWVDGAPPPCWVLGGANKRGPKGGRGGGASALALRLLAILSSWLRCCFTPVSWRLAF
jgi:hypothetical protein